MVLFLGRRHVSLEGRSPPYVEGDGQFGGRELGLEGHVGVRNGQRRYIFLCIAILKGPNYAKIMRYWLYWDCFNTIFHCNPQRVDIEYGLE